MSDDRDEEARKARGETLRRRVRDAGKREESGPLSPREATDRAAAEEARREREEEEEGNGD